MAKKKLVSGFSELERIESYSSRTFSELGALKRLRVLSTPPDNMVNIRFLSEDFYMIKLHNWLKTGVRDDGEYIRNTILCAKTFDFNAECVICNDGKKFNNRGVCIVGVVDNKDQPLIEKIDEASTEHYADYAKVMDEKYIVKNGDKLSLLNVPQVRILDMGINFWKSMSAFREKYGSICDRSYTVIRRGERLDTEYSVVPSDKDPEFKTPELLQMQFEPGLDFCMSIEDYLERLSSEKLIEGYKKYEGSKGDEKVEENQSSLKDMIKDE